MSAAEGVGGHGVCNCNNRVRFEGNRGWGTDVHGTRWQVRIGGMCARGACAHEGHMRLMRVRWSMVVPPPPSSLPSRLKTEDWGDWGRDGDGRRRLDLSLMEGVSDRHERSVVLHDIGDEIDLHDRKGLILLQVVLLISVVGVVVDAVLDDDLTFLDESPFPLRPVPGVDEVNSARVSHRSVVRHVHSIWQTDSDVNVEGRYRSRQGVCFLGGFSY